MKNFLAGILKNEMIAKDIYELIFECPDDALALFKPGQFAHIKIPGSNELILRRPFSISSAERGSKTAAVIYQAVGEGTRRLAEYRAEEIDVLMPLGNGFPLDAGYKKVLLIGGGLGIAPLRSVAEAMPDCTFDAVLGYRSKAYAYLTAFFKKTCRNTVIASDDGTIGTKGFVTDALKDLNTNEYDAIFACGPTPMLKALQTAFGGAALPVYASLEERMGCGMGGCAVCVCKIKKQDGFDFRKVCTEGPVFSLAEVDFT